MTIRTANTYKFQINNNTIKQGSCKEVCTYLANITGTDLQHEMEKLGVTITTIRVIRELMTIHRHLQGYEDHETGLSYN